MHRTTASKAPGPNSNQAVSNEDPPCDRADWVSLTPDCVDVNLRSPLNDAPHWPVFRRRTDGLFVFV
jgi:hypothetical protein